MTADALAPAGLTVGLSISGMTCDDCAMTLTEALSPLEGVRAVSVDHVSGLAVALLEADVDPEEFAFAADAAIHDAGYALETASLLAAAGEGGGCGGNCACGSASVDDAADDQAEDAASTEPEAHAHGGCGGGGCGGCC